MKLTFNKLLNKNEKYSKYLELMPDFKKEKTQKFTTIVLTIIAIMILSIFAINPTLSTIANLQKQLDDAKFVTTKLQEKINDLSVLQTKYNNIQADLPTVYGAIPQSAQAPEFTGQIQAIAADSSLSLISIQSNQITKSPKNFYFYSFTLTASGSYDSILVFLNKLTSMQRITDISSIDIANNTQDDNTLKINLRGLAFFKE